jgi:hypothetical protein
MNFQLTTTRQGGLRRIVRMLSILLVQHALAPGITEANMRSRLPGNRDGFPATKGDPLPYLRITGALALRFSPPPPPPPDLTTKPAASAPPFPVEVAPAAIAPSTAPTPISPADSAPKAPDATATPNNPSTPVVSHPPVEILPDDTRPTTRPEDFLPFFQFPSGNSDPTVVAPSTPPPPSIPGQLPPSSATYQQR